MKKKSTQIIIWLIIAIIIMIILFVGNSKQSDTLAPTITPQGIVNPTEAVPTINPTEIFHEHFWVTKEEDATCTEDGAIWEECECGKIQNTILINALGHKETEKKIIKEPTMDTEGEFELVCTICEEVIETGMISKKNALSEPVPTKVPEVSTIPSETITPTPVPMIMNVYTNDEGNYVTVYADGSSSVEIQKCNEIAIDSSHYRPIPETAEVVLCKNNYDNNNNLMSREYLLSFEEPTHHEDILFYYMYYYFDCGTNKLTCRLVNADGSFNQYSECVFSAYIKSANCKYVKKRNSETGKGEWKLKYIYFGSDNREKIYIAPEELIYYEAGEIRLYDINE